MHTFAHTFRSSGQLSSLIDIVETESFRRVSESSGYPTAGSFVSFLIDTRSLDAVRRFFSGENRNESRAAIQRRFADAFGEQLAAAEEEWHAFLDSGSDRPHL